MDSKLQLSMIIAILFYFFCLFTLLKKNKLTLKYSMLWMFVGLIMFLIAIFPSILEIPLHMLGIVEFTNGLFALVIFFLIIIIMSLTTVLSKLSENQREMIQKMSLYEYRIREIEKEVKK